jgi:hypothetical protein
MVGGTWVSKGAIETYGDDAVTCGKVEGGFASMGPDRKKLCHGCHNKLRIGSRCLDVYIISCQASPLPHLHIPGSIFVSLEQMFHTMTF